MNKYYNFIFIISLVVLSNHNLLAYENEIVLSDWPAVETLIRHIQYEKRLEAGIVEAINVAISFNGEDPPPTFLARLNDLTEIVIPGSEYSNNDNVLSTLNISINSRNDEKVEIYVSRRLGVPKIYVVTLSDNIWVVSNVKKYGDGIFEFGI